MKTLVLEPVPVYWFTGTGLAVSNSIDEHSAGVGGGAKCKFVLLFEKWDSQWLRWSFFTVSLSLLLLRCVRVHITLKHLTETPTKTAPSFPHWGYLCLWHWDQWTRPALEVKRGAKEDQQQRLPVVFEVQTEGLEEFDPGEASDWLPERPRGQSSQGWAVSAVAHLQRWPNYYLFELSSIKRTVMMIIMWASVDYLDQPICTNKGFLMKSCSEEAAALHISLQ